jgi:putative peptide zinc metalloprotease protein
MLSKPVAIVIILSLAAFFYQMYRHNTTFHLGNILRHNASNPWIVVYYYAIMLFTVVLHEFAHALTCKKYGGEVHKMGIMLYYFQICAYADTSDAWLFKERYKRILTSLNGPVFSTFLASLCLWVYYLLIPASVGNGGLIHSWLSSVGGYIGLHNAHPAIGEILMMVMAANILTSVLNMLPWTEMDAYYILTDLTNSPNLRLTAMGYVLNFFRRLLKKPIYPVSAPNLRVKISYSIYGTLCLLYGLTAIGFVLWFFIFLHDIALHSTFGIFLLVTIGLFCLKGILLKRLQKKRAFLARRVSVY